MPKPLWHKIADIGAVVSMAVWAKVPNDGSMRADDYLVASLGNDEKQ